MMAIKMRERAKQLALAGVGMSAAVFAVLAPVAFAAQSENMRVQGFLAQAQEAGVAYSQESREDIIGGMEAQTGSTETLPTPGTNLAPVIIGVSGPTDLEVNEVGTWTISAYDPDGNYLSYSVDWDDVRPLSMRGMSERMQQTVEFTHQYPYAGTYIIVFRVTDSKGAETQARITTNVQDSRVAEPSVALSYDTSSPKSHVVFPGEKQVGLVTYRISVANGVFNLPSFSLNLLDTASSADVGTVYVYSNGSLIGKGTFNAYGQAHIQLAVIIPNGTSQVWEVKADVKDRAQPGHRIALGLSSLEFPTQPEFAFTKIPHGWSNPMTIVYDNPLLPAEPPMQKEGSSSKGTASFAAARGFVQDAVSRMFAIK